MTILENFKYLEWVEVTLDGWVLKDGAPDYVKVAFKKYMKELEMPIND